MKRGGAESRRVGFLAKLKKDKYASFFDFERSMILEMRFKYSRERLAIPDWVDTKKVYWIIEQALLELQGQNTTIPNAYAWVSLRIKNAFEIMWGLKTLAHNFCEWEKLEPTILIDWTDWTIEETYSGKKIALRKSEI